MEKPLINATYRLEKFNGKGGWTFARIPKKISSKTIPFGWLKVKGSIDTFEIKKYHLMPMGDGTLMLPVKAEIRKKIKKTVGDLVHIVSTPIRIPWKYPKNCYFAWRMNHWPFIFLIHFRRVNENIISSGSSALKKKKQR